MNVKIKKFKLKIHQKAIVKLTIKNDRFYNKNRISQILRTLICHKKLLKFNRISKKIIQIINKIKKVILIFKLAFKKKIIVVQILEIFKVL